MAAFMRYRNLKDTAVRTKLKNLYLMVDLRLVLTPDVFCANTALMHTAFLSPLVAKLTKYLKILLTVLTTVYISTIANFVRNRRPPQAHHLPSFPIKTKNPLGSILTKMVTNGRT